MTQAKGLGAAVAFKGQEVEKAAMGHSAVLAQTHKVSVRGVGHCVCLRSVRGPVRRCAFRRETIGDDSTVAFFKWAPLVAPW